MTDLDALTRLWRSGIVTTADLEPDERRRVHQRVLELARLEQVARVELLGALPGRGKNAGYRLSDATKARMSAAKKAWWAKVKLTLVQKAG